MRHHAAASSNESRQLRKPRPAARSFPPLQIAAGPSRYPQELAVSCTALELSDRHDFGNDRATIFSDDLEFRLK
jgi:hypothetical protein